jgi:hypothetical protein
MVLLISWPSCFENTVAMDLVAPEKRPMQSTLELEAGNW